MSIELLVSPMREVQACPKTMAPWVVAHEDVLAVARQRASLERREGTTLLRAYRERVHQHLGYGGFAEYTDRHLGYCHRTTADKLRTAEALEQLPELALAQQNGSLHASAVRELARVATAETEAAWIEAARGRRVREVEKLVSGRARGDHPTSTPRPELEKHVLRFEVTAETLAAFRDAMQRLHQLSGEKLDDDSALLLLARAALRPAPAQSAPGNTDAAGGDAADALGRANYQVTVIVCDRCKRAYQPAGPDLVQIDPATFATACCDAQIIDVTRAGVALDANTHAGAGLSAATHADASLDKGTHAAVAPHVSANPNAVIHEDSTLDANTHAGAGLGAATHADATHEAERIDVGTHAGAALDAGTHAGAHTPRAKQSVPPAIRRHVLLRDHKTCQVPGCRNTIAIDVHHIQPRAEGGTHHAHNQIGICTVHHRAIHRGQLHVSGRAPDELVFTHADGTPYGGPVSAPRADVCKKVFDALCWLGFKSSEARRALDECTLADEAPQGTEALLRKALERLG